jgi:hypothetical protein
MHFFFSLSPPSPPLSPFSNFASHARPDLTMPKQKRLADSERQTLAGRSKPEVDATANMTAEASQIGIRICPITEYEDDRTMMSRNQDSQVMKFSLGIISGGNCGSTGNATTSGRKLSCEHCGVLLLV